ncbi:MAG: hypothetical protein MK135_06750, partial [Polyangiaceae bacterium]|nr:hypothetical protein [Polyangiaceae bacterium]
MYSIKAPSFRHFILSAVSTSLAACGGLEDRSTDTELDELNLLGEPDLRNDEIFASGGGRNDDSEKSDLVSVGGFGAGGGVGSGGTDHSPTGGTTNELEATCYSEESGWSSMVAGLNTEPQSDFVALLGRRSESDRATTGKSHYFIQESGVPCENATDENTCLAQMEEILEDANELYFDGPEPKYVVTNADGVAVHEGADAVRNLMGVIDTPNEAIVVGRSLAQCDEVRALEDGYSISILVCNPETFTEETFQILVSSSGEVTNTAPSSHWEGGCVVVGRLTDNVELDEDFDRLACRKNQSLAEYLSETAQFEAAAIAAFLRLGRELALHQAPTELVMAARKAAVEELGHATLMQAHARAHGGNPASATMHPTPCRSLFEIALENAREGCVNELFSAACVQVQARKAGDPTLRKT